MANEEHLKILKQGPTAWNGWRKYNPKIRPNLTRAYLSGVNLIGVNLIGADLSEANLREAYLSGVNLPVHVKQ